MHHARTAAIERHKARIDPHLTEAGVTAAEASIPQDAHPQEITAGIYVDRIPEFSVRDATWTADFYVWFRGAAGALPDKFDVVDGEIVAKEKQVERLDGAERFVRYRVTAKITKFFTVDRFPCDDHLLTLSVEFPSATRDKLLFVADPASDISSRAKINGYQIYQVAIVEKPHAYRTTRGDPASADPSATTWSQLRYGIWIQRGGWGVYFKMFHALFVAVAIAVIALFIKPTHVDPRFGLGVGALFAAVANSYVTSGLVPDTGQFCLSDIVNGLGVLMIFGTILQSTISLYIFDRLEQEALSRAFDKASAAILAVGYIVINVGLPWAARL